MLRDVDASIGLAMNAALEVRQSLAGVREPLLSVLDIYEQGLVSVTQDALSRIDALLLQLEQVGDQRALALFGTVGEDVDFTPKYFQAVGDAARQRMIGDSLPSSESERMALLVTRCSRAWWSSRRLLEGRAVK